MSDYIKGLFIFFIAALIIAFKAEELARHDDVIKRYNELKETAAKEKQLQEEKIKELEKEIRVLKQDIYIIQYGYETE